MTGSAYTGCWSKSANQGFVFFWVEPPTAMCSTVYYYYGILIETHVIVLRSFGNQVKRCAGRISCTNLLFMNIPISIKNIYIYWIFTYDRLQEYFWKIILCRNLDQVCFYPSLWLVFRTRRSRIWCMSRTIMKNRSNRGKKNPHAPLLGSSSLLTLPQGSLATLFLWVGRDQPTGWCQTFFGIWNCLKFQNFDFEKI